MGSMPSCFSARPTSVGRSSATLPPAFGVTKSWLPRSVSGDENSPCSSITAASPRKKLEEVPSSSTRNAE
jgi:hypothetical protein